MSYWERKSPYSWPQDGVRAHIVTSSNGMFVDVEGSRYKVTSLSSTRVADFFDEYRNAIKGEWFWSVILHLDGHADIAMDNDEHFASYLIRDAYRTGTPEYTRFVDSSTVK